MGSAQLGRRIAAVAGGTAAVVMVMFAASCSNEGKQGPQETTTTTTTTTTSTSAVLPTEKAPRIDPNGPHPFSPTVIAPPAPSATHPRTG
nr:hypothetical protein [Mycobacterium sp. E740]